MSFSLVIEKSVVSKRLIFESLKSKFLRYLDALEKKEKGEIKKSFTLMLTIEKGGHALPVGTVREWKGKKFIKTAPGKWRPKYDSHTRGAKLSIAALKRKIASCKDEHEMMQVVLENTSRFRDSRGVLLPIVQQLSQFIKDYQNVKDEKVARKPKSNNKKSDGYSEKDYSEYKGKGQEAVDFIVKNKGGQVRGAFHRKEIGDIDVVWGEVTDKEKHKGYGLAHIIDKHGMGAVSKIGEAVKDGEIVKAKNDIATIVYKDYKVGLSKGWQGKGDNHWIVTAYNKDENTAKTFDAGGQNSETTPSEVPKKGGYAKTTRSNKDYTEETLSETSHSKVTDSDKKVNPEEEHRNRSEAMKGNQNAKKDGITDKELSRMMPSIPEAEKRRKVFEYGFDLSNYYYAPLSFKAREFQGAYLDNDLYFCDRLSEVVKGYGLSKKEIRFFAMDIRGDGTGGYPSYTPKDEWMFKNIIVRNWIGYEERKWIEYEGEKVLKRLGFTKTKEVFDKMFLEYEKIIDEKNQKLLPLFNILDSGKSSSAEHKELGDIIIDVGKTGKSGYGLKHIIEQRYKKDGKSADKITALLCLIQDVLKDGKAKVKSTFVDSDNLETKHYEIEKNGILAYVSSRRFGKEEKFLLTGFESKDKNKEAEDAIKTVIAQYDYTEGFSAIRTQVGAIIASIENKLTDSDKKVNPEEEHRNRSLAMMGNQNAKKDGVKEDEEVETLKTNLNKLLQDKATKLPNTPFTRENYNNLFPRNKITTPLGIVKLGENQFEKLKALNRGHLLGAVAETLKNPLAIISEDRDGKNSKLYVKSFIDEDKNKQKIVQSVVVNIEGEEVSISTHERNATNVLNKIKRASSLIYMDKKTNPVAEQASSNKDVSVVSPTMTSGEDSHTSRSTFSNNSNKKSSSGISLIREKYNKSKHIEGDEEEIYIGDEAIKGKWKLVEADAPSASHDEHTFHKTEGFPQNEDGTTINDRDYEHDRKAQETVLSVAGKFDGRALSFDSPVVVSKDGVVLSGNNRTMSSKLAAQKGTDTAYIEALKKRAKKFGFSLEDVSSFKHPRVVFETAEKREYSTKEFSKYNQTQTKAQNPIEEAVKVSKIIKMETVKDISNTISEFETMGELYQDKKAVLEIFDSLQREGIINEFNRGQYEMDGGTITGAGKEFLETCLIGSFVNEANIRGLNREGCKSIRQKLVRAIAPLVNNKGMGGYSVTDELNKAIDIVMQVNTSKGKLSSVSDYEKQSDMFNQEDNKVAVALAKRLEGTAKDFTAFMQEMNASLKDASNGQVDIFFGGVESKADILARVLQLKKSLAYIIKHLKREVF